MKNRYLIRAIKYLIWLLLLVALILALLIGTGTSRYGFEETLGELFGSARGALMIGMILLLALLYPRFGYTVRAVRADMAANRDKILKAFEASGYRLESETPEGMLFRAATPLKKATLLWEDAIEVTGDGKYTLLEGVRKEVVKIEFRLKSYLQ